MLHTQSRDMQTLQQVLRLSNQKLSLERAQVVKDLLVKKYGISADRLKVAAGGGVDKFGQPILNRVVLVESAQ